MQEITLCILNDKTVTTERKYPGTTGQAQEHTHHDL